MNLGDWLGAQVKQFRERKDAERLRLVDCYMRGYDAREKDPDAAFAAFTEGARLAQQLGEPWWALFYENERVEALLHFKRDYSQVLDLAMKCVLEVRKPSNLGFPGRLSICDTLIAAYLGIDAEGYAEPIQQALDQMEAEVPQEPDSSRYLLLARRRIFALERGDLKAAHEGCMAELKLASGDKDRSRATHFGTFSYCGLCQIAGEVGAWETLAEWASAGEELARAAGHQCELSEIRAWGAVAAQRTGDASKANRLFVNATQMAGRIKMPPKRGYYDALVAFHEGQGDLAKAVAVRDDELRTIQDRGRLLYETRVRIARANLKARMGLLGAEDLESARAVASKLKKPERYLEQIRVLAEGGVLPPVVVDSSFVMPAPRRERAAPPPVAKVQKPEKPEEQKDSNSKKKRF